MKRKWWLVPGALALIGVLWILASEQARLEPLRVAIGLKPSVERAKSKPICTSPVNPNVAAPTDCIPQHLANLPPDPGAAGKATIEGIDSDKDGVRDDVQRYIAANYGHSTLAVKVLTSVALAQQIAVRYSDSLGREESQKLAPKFINAGLCYSMTASPEWRKQHAMQQVEIQVTNTPERFKRAHAFNYMLAHNVYMLGDETAADVCGFDPATIPN